jgi:hypothetical protein
MTFTKALIGLAAGVAITGAQAAAVTTLPGGYLGDNPASVFFYGDRDINTYSFKLLGSPSFKLSTSFAALYDTVDVSSITVTSIGGPAFSQTVSNPVTDTVNFTGLSAGSYTISFATQVAGSGRLIGAVKSSSFAMPIPESQTVILALAGVGLVSLLRRRHTQTPTHTPSA